MTVQEYAFELLKRAEIIEETEDTATLKVDANMLFHFVVLMKTMPKGATPPGEQPCK